VLACLFAALTPAGVAAQSGEYITNFNVFLELDESGVLSVTEALQYDFGRSDERHGIFREIPYRYDTPLGTKRIDVTVTRVVDGEGEPRPYRVTRDAGLVDIRIGDPDAFVSGQQIYQIEYEVRGAVLFLEERDELYWNLTGNSWSVPIGEASAIARLDFRQAGILEASCYQGPFGQNRPCAFATTTADNRAYNVIHRGLAPREGLTVALAFPKGVIEEPRADVQVLGFLRDHAIVLLPVLTFLVMLRLWWVRGRDPAGRGTIVRQYDPPEGLTPAEAGVLVDASADARDLTAQIIMLAARGYLRVHQFSRKKLIFTEQEYLLEKLRDPDDALDPVSASLLEVLFDEGTVTTERIEPDRDVRGVLLSSMKHRMHETASDLRTMLYEDLVRKGYFPHSPRRVRAGWVGAAFGFVALSGGLFFFTEATPIAYGSIALAGFFVGAFGVSMVRRTKRGVRAKEHLLGLKQYLAQAEQERLAHHHDVERVPAWFDQMLPFAMVLGVERAWARLFADIYHEEPQWFTSHTGAAFSAEHFSADLTGFASAMAATTTSAASGGSGAGGGGFSGGGFGGGGGGSW
jgi:hypothetical protein